MCIQSHFEMIKAVKVGKRVKHQSFCGINLFGIKLDLF